MKKIILLMLFFFLFTCQTNKSGKVDGLTNSQLVMLLYLTPNVELRYTDISSPQTRVMVKANGIDPALLKNINGIPVSQAMGIQMVSRISLSHLRQYLLLFDR